SYGLAARPPAHFSWLLDVPEITTTENKNQTEKPFTQNPLQNLNTSTMVKARRGPCVAPGSLLEWERIIICFA
ncbi:MAG TPA: hypothetical protein VGY56_19270, partial [Verrucomicrobiae bacterium]|nr:hypothetical protein [Verrucomicrobiae bacterium]